MEVPIRSVTTEIPMRMSTAGAAPAPLPELPYSLRDHKKGIAVTWTIILANTCFVPLGLTYGLWFGTHPQINQHLLFGITSVAFTVASAFQYWMRIFRLLQQDPIYRPIGSQRGWLDFYQIASTIATIISIAVFVIGLTLNPVSVRLLATPPSIVILISSASLLLTSGLTLIGARTPFRISSMPAGSICRPGIYSIIEDVIAVDTGTGRKYREALNERYQSSGAFRKMLLNLNLFWALGGCVFGSVVIALCYEEVVDPIAAYGIGWTLPFLWAAVWTIVTIRWVQKDLRKEKREWANGWAQVESYFDRTVLWGRSRSRSRSRV